MNAFNLGCRPHEILRYVHHDNPCQILFFQCFALKDCTVTSNLLETELYEEHNCGKSLRATVPTATNESLF